MKRFLYIIVALLALTGQANAQRYLPGMKGIQLTGGTVNGIDPQKAFHAGVAVATYTKNGNRWVIGGEYLQKQFDYKDIKIPVAQFTGEAGYYFKFLSDGSKTVFLSIGGSALAGYETSNWGAKQLFDGSTLRNKDAFLYGGAITLELETYITDRIVFLINARERVLWGSSVGKFNTQLAIGLKFIIN